MALALATTTLHSRALAEESEWVADLRHMLREIELRHPNPEHFGPRWSEFTARADELAAGLDALPDWRKPWEFSRLVARLADGHTWVDAASFAGADRQLPLRFQSFDDGVFVVAAPADDEALREHVGARVTHIGALEADELYERARAMRLTSADNPESADWWTDRHLRMPSALAMLGAIEHPGPVRLALVTDTGDTRVVELRARPASTAAWRGRVRTDGSVSPVTSSDDERLYSTELRADHDALVLRWNGFREDSRRPWPRFLVETFARFREQGLARLVIDLRGNGGGNPALGTPLLRAILREPALAEPGALVVLIGRATDSAAVSFCALLERYAEPVFVGTPTFLRPNGHSDALPLSLPRTGLGLRVSTLYWRMADPRDRRPWIAPHVPVPVRHADIESGVDVALERALEGPRPVAPTTFRPKLRRGHAGEDLRAALSEWRSLPANRWADVEADVNALGYALLGDRRLDDALEVFALNVEWHPHASNVYDSYGEALRDAGNERQALAMYREALRRDHTNPAAVAIVLELEDRLRGDG